MSRIAFLLSALLALLSPSLVTQGLTPAGVEAKLLAGSLDPLAIPAPDNKKKCVQWLFDLLDLAWRPLLTAVLVKLP